MKDQYFGDTRDLFKFDLLESLLKSSGGPRRLTYVPMLTRPDQSRHGGRHLAESTETGSRNAPLRTFLTRCADTEMHRVTQIKRHFGAEEIAISIYRENASSYFEHQSRGVYFDGIGGDLLSDSLVFIDPDIGLEVSKPDERHLLNSEVTALYDRMDERSVVVIYQHFPRVERSKYVRDRQEDLSCQTGGPVLCIYDPEVAFFLVVKGTQLAGWLEQCLESYAQLYPNVSISLGAQQSNSTDLIANLRALNRKARFFLVGTALGNRTFRLCDDFRSRLGRALGLEVPSRSFVAMDYHLDWLYAALSLTFLGERGLTYLNDRQLVRANQEDVDLIIAFQQGREHHIVLLEAKGDSSFDNDQIRSKVNRLIEIFADPPGAWHDRGVVPHFALVSPRRPQRVNVVDWPCWMRAGGQPIWLRLPMPTDLVQVSRCQSDGTVSAVGDYWRTIRRVLPDHVRTRSISE